MKNLTELCNWAHQSCSQCYSLQRNRSGHCFQVFLSFTCVLGSIWLKYWTVMASSGTSKHQLFLPQPFIVPMLTFSLWFVMVDLVAFCLTHVFYLSWISYACCCCWMCFLRNDEAQSRAIINWWLQEAKDVDADFRLPKFMHFTCGRSRRVNSFSLFRRENIKELLPQILDALNVY